MSGLDGVDMANLVTHFEIYGDKPAQLAEFYRSVFGWQVEQAAGVDYWWIRTNAASASGFDAGMTYRPIREARSWVHYISVDSLDGAVAQAQRLGAAVLITKTAVPKTGWYALLADPEGNVFAVWQADLTACAGPSR